MTRRLSLLLLLAGSLMAPAMSQGAADAEREATVTLQRHSNGTGTLEVELRPQNSWSRDLFISLYRDEFRERRGIRPDEAGGYRLDVRVPVAGRWGVYLRYGVAQAGYAGYGTLTVPQPGGTASTQIELARGFANDVPEFVQPLGFAVFAVIAGLTLLGLRMLLNVIRQRQTAGDTA